MYLLGYAWAHNQKSNASYPSRIDFLTYNHTRLYKNITQTTSNASLNTYQPKSAKKMTEKYQKYNKINIVQSPYYATLHCFLNKLLFFYN